MAREQMAAYIKAKRAKAKQDEAMKAAKEYLMGYAEEHADRFDEKRNLYLPGGYLHVAVETSVEACADFDLMKFYAQFPELVDHKLKTSAIKEILKSEDGVKKLTEGHCVELSEIEKIEIVVK